ncbi:hypothetical protein [Persicitalea jodogahamensis]|uniref:Uncharacterized protein n=1 Tax=Persicitalea jodogahamensis TaxID=402147 RepID=A0A8J3D886_9BACT|nr:hypothetical protein [Persicitalea jodogahamensis]GHB87268.1 hypothetical protein GCM10007390_48820 [Persicitalea jodogahamensis]
MDFFTNSDRSKVVKVRDLGERTTITATDAQSNISRTYSQPVSYYLKRLKERGYHGITPERYAEVRAALIAEHKYHFSPEFGRAIYAQLAA